jgi:hypothetical protein
LGFAELAPPEAKAAAGPPIAAKLTTKVLRAVAIRRLGFGIDHSPAPCIGAVTLERSADSAARAISAIAGSTLNGDKP